MPKTMFEKIWEAHEVRAPEREGGASLLYIDLHLVHEVTSPQAFEGLRLAGRKVRRPDRTLATVDHNVPTDPRERTALDAIADQLSREQVEALERNCAEFGVPLYGMRSARQGIVHVIGPELGVTPAGHHDRLRRLAHVHARRARRAGDADRHLRGRARARHAVPAAGAGRRRCGSPTRASPASASRRRT